jgi:hypothetical protein
MSGCLQYICIMSHEPMDARTSDGFQPAPAGLRLARWVRRICGFIAFAAFVFAVFNAGDRNPLQWSATFTFMGCVFAYLFIVLAVWVIEAAHRRTGRRMPGGQTRDGGDPR